MPNNTSAQFLPTTPNTLSSFSHDTSIAIVLPFDEASTFLTGIKELPNDATISEDIDNLEPHSVQSWVMEAAKRTREGPRLVPNWRTNAWTKFVDLIKVIDVGPHSLPFANGI